ncbi:MAG: HIT domain-containing protein [Rectinemataceae bacterium]
MNICYSCKSNSGEKRISPGKQIFEGNYWVIEHAYPTGLLGWIVIVLKRHCEELHNLKKEEWNELADIQYRLLKALNDELEIRKEYFACFAELEGFKHIHFHVIPKTKEYIDEYKGTKAFQYLKIEEEKCISKNQIIALCENINKKMKAV